jgi:hypothetical protein
VVIQVYDHKTMQENHGTATFVLTLRMQETIAKVTAQPIPAWIAEEMAILITCLEDLVE